VTHCTPALKNVRCIVTYAEEKRLKSLALGTRVYEPFSVVGISFVRMKFSASLSGEQPESSATDMTVAFSTFVSVPDV